MKYNLSKHEDEILPNLLGLKTPEEIALSEFEGFLKAEILLSEKLSVRTKFNLAYIVKSTNSLLAIYTLLQGNTGM